MQDHIASPTPCPALDASVTSISGTPAASRSRSKLARTIFFGERSSQLRGCADAVAGGDPGDTVSAGDSGPMFVTNSGPILGIGTGEPGV